MGKKVGGIDDQVPFQNVLQVFSIVDNVNDSESKKKKIKTTHIILVFFM